MQPEQPWIPDPNQFPWTTFLINPQGDRHLAFDDNEGRFYRIWRTRAPEPLHGGDAILLRPSDVDLIIQFAMIWSIKNAGSPRAHELAGEIAAGSKAAIMHFAGQ